MLLKRGDQDLIDQARADPRVREALDIYREFRRAFDINRVRPTVAVRFVRYVAEMKDGSMLMRGLSHPEVRSKVRRAAEVELFNELIPKLAEVYRQVTGRSPTTTDSATQRHRFADFVRELFKAEGLEPPAINAVRRALKGNN